MIVFLRAAVITCRGPYRWNLLILDTLSQEGVGRAIGASPEILSTPSRASQSAVRGSALNVHSLVLSGGFNREPKGNWRRGSISVVTRKRFRITCAWYVSPINSWVP